MMSEIGQVSDIDNSAATRLAGISYSGGRETATAAKQQLISTDKRYPSCDHRLYFYFC